MPQSNQPSNAFVFPPSLERICTALGEGEYYLVGGAVRDLLLGREIHDFDLALPRDGIRTARRIANLMNGAFYALDTERDTGRVLLPAENGLIPCIDFVRFRDGGDKAGNDLHEDLRGRDFTINAMALDLHKRVLIDPLSGARDLKDKVLRLCAPDAIKEDPVRILRAVRLAADLKCRIDPQASRAMKQSVAALPGVSPERLRDELFRILEGSEPAACMRVLDSVGALSFILPELIDLKRLEQPLPHVHDGWQHTLSALAHLESILGALQPAYDPGKASDLINGMLVVQIGRYRNEISSHLQPGPGQARSGRGLLFFAALYHDVGKPAKRTQDENGRVRFLEHDRLGAGLAAERARLLVLSNSEIDRLEQIIRNHMRLLSLINHLIDQGQAPTRKAVYRFFRDCGAGGVEICLLALADMRATFEHTLKQEEWGACLQVVRLLLENWFERPQESVRPVALLDGTGLMEALGITPGPRVGRLLEIIREAQAAGEISTCEQALDLARDKLDNEGSTPVE